MLSQHRGKLVQECGVAVVFIGQVMEVCIHSYLNRAVAHLPGNPGDRGAFLQKKGCVCVAQIVKPDFS